MNKKLAIFMIIFVLLFLSVSFTACDDSSNGDDSGINVTFIFNGSNAVNGYDPGEVIYAKLITSGDCSDEVPYSETATLSLVTSSRGAPYNVSATLTANNITAGDYTACAFVDANDSVSSGGSATPDSEDYMGYMALTVANDMTNPVLVDIDSFQTPE